MCVVKLDNPLRIHHWMRLVVVLYLPLLVFISLILNGLALQVLKSEFLQDLTSQPILRCLVALHFLLPIVGPFYVWLVQAMHVFVTVHQVYSCFLLLTLHNFLMIACSWIVILLTVERAVTPSKSKTVWRMWQTACGKVMILMLGVSMLTAVGPLVFIDGPILGQNAGVLEPICIPWWGQGPTAAVWFQVITVVSTVGPCVAIVLAILILMVFVVRFCALVHLGSKSLDHYKAVHVGLKSVMHVKFVHSALWLGFLFILTSGSLGLFILLPPSFKFITRATNTSFSNQLPLDKPQGDLAKVISHRLAKSSSGISVDAAMLSTFSEHPDDNCETFKCTSRADIECLLWLLYYSFSVMVVPVLVLSEVLFRREWKGLLMRIGDSFLCIMGKGKITRPMTIQLHAAFSTSDLSVCHGENMANKLDPVQNANVESFINTSRWPGNLKLKNTTTNTWVGDAIAGHSLQTDDVRKSRLQSDVVFKSPDDRDGLRSDATAAKDEDQV